jgi:hypothetical protein
VIANDQKDFLFSLIKSLNKSEKRQFKLFVGRLDVNSDSIYLNLFNFLDKANDYNEKDILKSSVVKKQQLANVKAHLYKQILISLRLTPLHKNIRSVLREQLDFASILYHKGLYKQSLKILDKAKETAMEYEEKNMAYEIVELEKVIESQYITRSIATRADELSVQAKELSQLNVISSKLSNLSLQLYSIILKSGYVKNKEESDKITAYFQDRLPKYEIKNLGFREKLWVYNAYLWYNFILQDFLNSYKYAAKWVNLFHQNPNMIVLNPVFFLKGSNYHLEALFFLQNKPKFQKALKEFEEKVSEESFPKDENVEALKFLYLIFHSINEHFIDGSFQDGLALIPKIESDFKNYSSKIDEHHKMIFYFKFASLQFGAANNKESIFYLDKIISNKTLEMREDLLCFARVLNILAHYEAGLDDDLEFLLKSTYRFLIKMNDLHEVQKEMIKFIRDLQNVYPHNLKQTFKDFHKKLKVYETHPFERRAFLYLDILSYLESKIENKPVARIIYDKYLERSK